MSIFFYNLIFVLRFLSFVPTEGAFVLSFLLFVTFWYAFFFLLTAVCDLIEAHCLACCGVDVSLSLWDAGFEEWLFNWKTYVYFCARVTL